MTTVIGDVILDGETVPLVAASVPVTDLAVQRGYGCFEVIRSYDGVPFRLDTHLHRLAASASMLALPLPPERDLTAWAADRAAEGDCLVRIVVTGGSSIDEPGLDNHAIVTAERLPDPVGPQRILPLDAPWHSDGASYGLTAAKTLSYAPNMTALRTARLEGFDDALLIGRSGIVLEGPTWTPGWVVRDRLEVPDPALGVLPGVTVAAVLEVAQTLGLEVSPVRRTLSEVRVADEVVAMSTVREVVPVVALGDLALPVGPVAASLHSGFRALVAAECAPQTVGS